MNLTAALLLLGFALLALGAGARWLAQYPGFAIRSLSVQGELSHTSALNLRAQVTPQIKGTLLTVDLQAVRQAFESLPWVRRALVQREFPNRLRVTVQEHQALAYWGDEDDSTLLNSYGEVFEANLGEIEQDDLPHLSGPAEQSREVLAMYQALRPQFERAQLPLVALALSRRGNWLVSLDNGARIELGAGETAQVQARAQQFLGTLAQVAAQYGRTPQALETADLRYPQGYALRLRGVSTPASAAASRL